MEPLKFHRVGTKWQKCGQKRHNGSQCGVRGWVLVPSQNNLQRPY